MQVMHIPYARYAYSICEVCKVYKVCIFHMQEKKICKNNENKYQLIF